VCGFVIVKFGLSGLPDNQVEGFFASSLDFCRTPMVDLLYKPALSMSECVRAVKSATTPRPQESMSATMAPELVNLITPLSLGAPHMVSVGPFGKKRQPQSRPKRDWSIMDTPDESFGLEPRVSCVSGPAVGVTNFAHIILNRGQECDFEEQGGELFAIPITIS